VAVGFRVLSGRASASALALASTRRRADAPVNGGALEPVLTSLGIAATSCSARKRALSLRLHDRCRSTDARRYASNSASEDDIVAPPPLSFFVQFDARGRVQGGISVRYETGDTARG